MSETAVIIPIYKNELSSNEEKSLRQAIEILSSYPLIAIIPESLDAKAIGEKYPALRFEKFDSMYFSSIRGYNRLALSPVFYRRFSSYKYILIYQLDAYVFSDRLEEWTRKGYDYIGAPWIPMKNKYFTFRGKAALLFNRIFRRNNGIKTHNTVLYNVGNGGLSLRKTDTFIKLTEKYKNQIEKQLDDNAPFYPEDLWLLYETGRNALKKPSWKEALSFSFEQNPEKSFELNGNRLPFGCHAWYHKNYYPFWKDIIK